MEHTDRGLLKRAPASIQLYSGGYIDLLNPDPRDIKIEDIAHALANQARFAGMTQRRYSVAEHSCRVAWESDRDDRLWGLLHDAAEAYILDLPRPLKYAPGMEGYRVIEAGLISAISRRFGLWPMTTKPESVRLADEAMLRMEARRLMRPVPDYAGGPEAEFDDPTYGWDPGYAEASFLRLFAELWAPHAAFLRG